MDTKRCETCGKEFPKPCTIGRPAWEKRRYCSRGCFGEDHSRRLRRERTCETCGKTFQIKHFGAKYCSHECAKGRFLHKQGSNSYNWKGGRYVDPQGYVSVYLPDDHRFASLRRNGRYILEHRLVMAEHLDRLLTRKETVHHINGDRHDNRIENLQLRTGRHGKGRKCVCAECGSENIVEITL